MSEEYSHVKFLRFKTGEDIISEMVEVGEDDIINYHLINPFKVVYIPTGKPGYVQISFMPWVFISINDKQEFTIKSDDVLLVSDISESMEKYYWEVIERSDDPEPDEEDLERLKEALNQLTTGRRTIH